MKALERRDLGARVFRVLFLILLILPLLLVGSTLSPPCESIYQAFSFSNKRLGERVGNLLLPLVEECEGITADMKLPLKVPPPPSHPKSP